jgi:hypothetical protein
MGGAVSELRGHIHTHVLIARHYPLLLEPQLAVVQFFLRTAESGEGTDKERPLDDIPTDIVLTDKKLFEEASTEVELLVENGQVMQVLLAAVAQYARMELSPEIDPFRAWYDPPWRHGRKPMPRFVEISDDQVPRFRIAVLRSSVRCLRLLMFCSDGKMLLESLGGPEVLNRAAHENPLDDYVKKDVKAIFKAVYGGDNAVRRIAMGDVATVVEMSLENGDSAIVQLASVQRFCKLLGDVKALFYVPSHDASAPETVALDVERQKLFMEIESHGVVTLVTEALARFDVDRYLALYVHVCRFIVFVALEPRNAKLVGQAGGVDGAVRLLLKAREMQREKKHLEKQAAIAKAKLEALGQQDDWAAIMATPEEGESGKKKKKKPTPPPAPLNSGEKVTSLESLAVVDFTPTEIGQQAMWALDLLAQLEFNVSQMKRCKLKYLLEEIRLDPDQHELGAALIITRRLRLIRWDEITDAPPENGKELGSKSTAGKRSLQEKTQR